MVIPEPAHRPRRTRSLGDVSLRTWNRKLHYYLGLYFLLFIWLFSISGLLLNHSSWASATFWERRVESSYERALQLPAAADDAELARGLMAELQIEGEINDVIRSEGGDSIRFQVVKPGQVLTVSTHTPTGATLVRQIDLNAWGVMDALHKFTGVSMTNPERQRDWVLTRIWSIAMDALALGLIVLVLSGIYLWAKLPGKRKGGSVSLAAGLLVCAFFLFGIGRLF